MDARRQNNLHLTESGVADIWSMDEDGKNQKQLTASQHGPVGTPDGHYIVFTSHEQTASGVSGAWTRTAATSNN